MSVRSVRNNNPGNIRTGGDQWNGSVGDDGAFVTFESPEMGARAMARTLNSYQTRHGLTTVDQMISRWAPPNENDTRAYTRFVAERMGVSPHQTIDLQANPELQTRMMSAMIAMEGGAAASAHFNDDVIRSGVALANGGTPPAAANPPTPVNPNPVDPRPAMTSDIQDRIDRQQAAIDGNLAMQAAREQLASDQADWDAVARDIGEERAIAQLGERPHENMEGDPYNFTGARAAVSGNQRELDRLRQELADEQSAWDEEFGETHNPDGTPKTQAGDETIDAETPDNAPARPSDSESRTRRDEAPTTLVDKTTTNWYTEHNLPTYKWTFYLVKPEIWNNPVVLENDDSVTNAGNAVVIAESGVEAAFAIENMLMLSKLVGGTGAVGTFQFDLLEPYGFTFMDRLTALQPAYYGQMGIQAALFVLKLEFIGRDPLTDIEKKWPGSFFYPCTVREMKASLDASGSRYNIVAFNTKQSSETNATVVTDIQYTEVDNVGSLATSLETALNDHERDIRATDRPDNDVDPNVPDRPRKTWEITFDESATSAETVDGGSFDLSRVAFSTTADQAQAAMLNASNEDPNLRNGTVGNNTNMKVYLEHLLTTSVPEFAAFVAAHRDQGYKIPFIHVDTETVASEEVDGATNQRAVTERLIVEIKWAYTNVERDPEVARQRVNDPDFQRTRFGELPINKVYRYLYSGENTELLNFDLTFDSFFFNARDPGMGFVYAQPSGQVHPGSVIANTLSVSGNTVQNRNALGAVQSGKFLSDIKIDQDDMVLTIPQFGFQALGSQSQQVADIDNGNIDAIDALRDKMYAERDTDFLTASFEIVGDPFWMGQPGAIKTGDQSSNLEYADADTMIGFINYFGKEEMYSPGWNSKADMDLISSGVYKITDIESKFQNGQFTQILKGFKDNRTRPSIVKNQLENLG